MTRRAQTRRWYSGILPNGPKVKHIGMAVLPRGHPRRAHQGRRLQRSGLKWSRNQAAWEVLHPRRPKVLCHIRVHGRAVQIVQEMPCFPGRLSERIPQSPASCIKLSSALPASSGPARFGGKHLGDGEEVRIGVACQPYGR